MSSTGVSSSSTDGAVADRLVVERGRFGGRARLAWTVIEERAAGLFIIAALREAQSLALIIYFHPTSLIIRLRTQLVALTRPRPADIIIYFLPTSLIIRLRTQLVALTDPDHLAILLAMSSTHKPSSDSKRSHLPHQTKISEQYRTQVRQLQDLFPAWSTDGPSLIILT